ncbi:MAG: ATP-binding protein [Syntrophorhabdaceae bacterium]
MARRKIVCIDEKKCNGCGQCVTACAEGAIGLKEGKARLIAEKYCDGLAACLGTCPQDAISIIEREADEFDPEAVEEYLSEKTTAHPGETANPSALSDLMPCGCPSTQLHMFDDTGNAANGTPRRANRLTHWPIQVRLVPHTAPFLKNADLLVASDCTPAAYPNFHADLLKGKVLMLGCPKFDDTEEYIDKFTQIFRTANIKSVTIAIMEVPCCSKMPLIVETAMKKAGKSIPKEVVVINARGEIRE